MSRPPRPGPSFLARVLRRRPDEPLPPPEPDAHEPAPEPEPEPQPEPEPEPPLPGPDAVAPEPQNPVPRSWNLWELERVLREHGRRSEEREFLLLYLRDYAGPDGELPVTFDGLVRESFGDLLGAPAR